MDYKNYFKNKKITVMGLGLLGRGVGDVEFLAKCKADLIVTDLKTESELATSLKKLKSYKLQATSFILGGHRLEDFRGRDFILKAAGVPLDSPFIAEAEKNNIPVKMSSALFVELTEGTIIGVTGTRGKSTTTHLIFHILKEEALRLRRLRSGQKNPKIFLAGNVKGVSTLALLPKVKKGDFVVMELDSWQLQGFDQSRISPHIAVFTTFLPDHMNYYKNSMDKYFTDKINIFKYQTKSDFLIVGESFADSDFFRVCSVSSEKPKGKMIVAHTKDVPADWKIKIPGKHNLANISCAIAAARVLGISDEIIKGAVESFKGVEGRLQLIKTIKGIKIYNDTTATTPEATIAALKALISNFQFPISKQNSNSKFQNEKRIILIMGGADKGLNMNGLAEEIPKYCKAVVFLEGTGTEKLIFNFQFSIFNEFSMFKFSKLKDAVEKAFEIAEKGDIVLFSPAFASFGMFKNEYDRGEQFEKIVKSL